MKSLFDTEPYSEIKSRVEVLTPNTTSQWGKMKVDQMLVHCQQPLKVSLQKMTVKTPNFLIKLLMGFFKKKLYNDDTWRKNLPTSPDFIITGSHDFEKERTELLDLINTFHSQKNKTDWVPHPLFGKFTKQQWGKMQYKHLDHHLKQFGV